MYTVAFVALSMAVISISLLLPWLLWWLVAEARIFYPPFPPPGQFHEPPPTLPPPPTPPRHMPYNRPNHQRNNLLHLIQLYINQMRTPQYHPRPPPQYHHPPPHPPQYHPQPTRVVQLSENAAEGEQGTIVGGTGAEGVPAPEGGAVMEGGEPGLTTTLPSVLAGLHVGSQHGLGVVHGGVNGLGGMGGAHNSLNGLVVLGAPQGLQPMPAHGVSTILPALGYSPPPPPPPPLHPLPGYGALPPPPGLPNPPYRAPTIYNLRNNVPNNPLPIAQIRNQFYERLCYQVQPTVLPIIQHFHPGFHPAPMGADTADPPSCSCIPYQDCESTAHMFINNKTKDECGSTLTGFACCCEEPPFIG